MTIHILRFGFPLCLYSRRVPRDWPEGHTWVQLEDFSTANCEECRRWAIALYPSATVSHPTTPPGAQSLDDLLDYKPENDF